MLKRTLTAIVLIAMLAGFMVCGYFVSTVFVDMLILVFLAGSVFEMRRCLKGAGYDIYLTPSLIMLLCAYPVFYLMQYFVGEGSKNVSAGVQGLLMVFLLAVAVCLAIFTFKPLSKKNVQIEEDNGESTENDGKKRLNDLFANIFILVYPTLFLGAAWILSYKYSALFAVLFAVFVPILGSDTFAYFVGSIIGGKKLCPAISPKKTVAGAIGGIFGGIILSMLFWVVFEYVGGLYPAFCEGCKYTPFFAHSDGGWAWKSALVYIAIGAACGVMSEVGDLAASSIKRALGIKDYGKIFPGHGGFMDRIDSVAYCIVVLLIAFSCIYGY